MHKQHQPFDSGFVADRINILVAGEPKEFAWRTGVSLSAVYNYLGGRTPTIAIIIKIARAYGKDINWFFREFQPDTAKVPAPSAGDFIERRLELVRRQPKRVASA